ncbi:DeoR/GlpR family DNA-binding transcription regulator [Aquibium sp. A9E412]|uniref:DeoR/GlpR family DNA-binding transcription regulator n=1 Tax=Aquibium sp. A9E412 TaxID=2976767 RepID=UPI0025B03DB1|nr:DeoR/GlpR family DNA-binding transcription regulator [Aquibium sp. A9E412]MDN2568107.1 DeoR/GlpR family DNA-binding transcription regulator [Aquibium sp. A9E412]
MSDSSPSPSGRALAPQRQAVILQHVREHGVVSIAEMARVLGVSRETVRRDLKVLAEQRAVSLLHGGAARVHDEEPALSQRREENAAGKAAIGRRAAELVTDGMVVLLDSGTTALAVAHALKERRNLTVFTPSLAIALLLCHQPGIRVHMPGGEVEPREEAIGGIDALNGVAALRVDLAFVGAGSLTADGAVTDFTRLGAEMRAAMIGTAGAAYFILDSSKFGRPTPMLIPGFAQAAGVIVDRRPAPATVQALDAQGLGLLVAAP